MYPTRANNACMGNRRDFPRFGVLLISLFLMAGAGGRLTAQNIEGQIVASQYGKWKVPGFAPNTYSGFAPDSCRVQGGASYFFAFQAGTPVTLVDGNPSLNEVLVPSATVESNVTCSVTVSPVNNHQVPFFFTTATGGLQEALNQNMTNPQPNTVILDNTFYQMVGGAANAANTISTVKGSYELGLEDITQVPTVWYRWNGTQYVPVGNGGMGTGLNTLVNDLVSNNATNSAAQDLYHFYATSSYSPAASLAAAEAHNGVAALMPSVGRQAFQNTGNVRVLDYRTDVPADARGVTEFGAQCDSQSKAAEFTQGSTAISIGGVAMDQSYVGRVVVAVGSISGMPTVFESVIATVVDGGDATVTTPFPFSQTTGHAISLGHDDTAAIAQGMSVVGGSGTLLFPQGNCLTHTQTLAGQSPVGVGPDSWITGFPGEDIFAAPDPSVTTGVNQGSAHIHDLTFSLDQRIDATRPWQLINETTVTSHPGVYRPIAPNTSISNSPLAPGWFQGGGANNGGASNGVASITDGSAVMCVPAAENAPAVAQVVVFPYLSSVFTATVASAAGSCTAGTPRTLSAALPAGSSNTQAEWFAGTSPQNLATAIGSSSCPATITVANPIAPVAGFEANVAAFGLIQIDGEQFSYFGKSMANNATPANTFYNVQCAQNGSTRAAHAVGATIVPLNRFQPSYPWPVTPTINSGDTTPSGTAGFFPAWNAGNAVFAFPIANGQSAAALGAWGPNSRIENISAFSYPNDVNGYQWLEVNNGALFYFVSPPYGAKFTNISALYLFYGLAEGTPSLENGNWASHQPTADGTSWDQVALFAANPVNMTTGGQNSYSNFNVYSNEATSTGTSLGADTCFYFTSTLNDQNGGVVGIIGNTEFHNLYCENEGGAHDDKMPIWEWDTVGSQIYDQHMGGGGEVAIGGARQHWFSGNFSNDSSTPVINWGLGNTSEYSSGLGLEPKGNVYGSNSLINFGGLSDFSGTTSQVFGTATGPYGSMQTGGRAAIPSQTAETFFTGNLTEPFSSLSGAFITPDEFNSNFAFESEAMNVGDTFDDSSPVTHAYTGCNVGNNPAFIYCSTYEFNQDQIPIGPGQRMVPGKYVLWASLKDVTAATNQFHLQVWSNCANFTQDFYINITNAWPSGIADYVNQPIDFSSLAGSSGCVLGLRFMGVTTADQVRVGFIDFAPVAEQLTAQTLNVTNIVGPGGATGCQQSPITGIEDGYTCPTRGWGTTLAANEGLTDTSVTLTSGSGLSPSGCFFIDTEYECYTGLNGTVLTGVTRGAYQTTAATHNGGATVASVDLVLGSTQQIPSDTVTYGGVEPPILGVNNATPFAHGGSSVLSINSGSNETWVDSSGTLHQENTAVVNQLQGSLYVGVDPNAPVITDSGLLLQTNGPNTAYQPLTLGGGHAGSLNVITSPTIGAPSILAAVPAPGTSTISYVCSGTDFDGNLINGTTATITNGVSSWAYPYGYQVQCPWSAGVDTFQIYRTAGGVNQGLMASGVGPGFILHDFGGSATAGSPPAANGSNPHISVQGTGTPAITLGTGGPQIMAAAGAPPSGCGSGYANGSLYIRVDGSVAGSDLLFVCDGSTGSWVDVK